MSIPVKGIPLPSSEPHESEAVRSRAEFDARFDAWFPRVARWFIKRFGPGSQAEEAIGEVFVRGIGLFRPSHLSEAQRETWMAHVALTVDAELARQRSSTNDGAVPHATPSNSSEITGRDRSGIGIRLAQINGDGADGSDPNPNEKETQTMGAIDKTKGKIKEGTGALTDDEALKKKGQADQKRGEAKDKDREALREKEKKNR
jgi:uncharacterized protein YjbJ (UPF0337 family)